MEIVRATLDKADDMGYVHAMSWQKAYDGIVPKEILDNFTPEKRAESFRNKMLQSAGEEYYIAYSDGNPAGIMVLGKCRDNDADKETGELYAIYLLAEYWGRNIGRQLFDFGMSRLKELGFQMVKIWVLEDNRRARRFYEKCGFVPDGAKKEVEVGKPMTVVRYSRSIG